MEYLQGDSRLLYIKHEGNFMPVACLTGNPLNESVEVLETTTRSSNGWKTIVPTKQTYDISFNGIQALDSTGKLTYQLLRQKKRNRELIEWRISGQGLVFDTGFGYITDIGESNEAGDSLLFSGRIDGYGSPGEKVEGGDLWEDGDTILFQDGNNLIFN